MPQYQYTGLDSSGRNVKAVINADSVAAAKTNLRKDGIFPSSIKEVEVSYQSENQAKKKINLFQKKIPIGDLSNMTRQMATLVASHIPLVEALDALTDQIENPRLKAAISRIRTDVNEGSTLSKALSKYPDIFSDLFVNMVASGETSGALDVVLLRLADFLEYQDRLFKKVRGAMIYPLIMICFGLGAVLVIFTVVIPELESVFADSRQALPLITQIILWFSRFTLEFWWLMVLLFVGLAIGIKKYLDTEGGKRWWDQISLKLPVFGDLIRMISVSRFTKTLSTLLRSGIPLLPSLRVVKNVVSNTTIREAIEQASTNLTEGQGISGPLKRSGQFPPLVTHMVTVGEKTGELENMLEKVSEHYEYQVNTRVESFTALLEPIMILLLAGIVLVIVLSVILPMIELNNTVI